MDQSTWTTRGIDVQHSLNDKFELEFSTKFGRDTLKTCNQFVCLDATHNTTRRHYNLFTLLVQNEYSHGVPVAFLLCSDATTTTIERFLRSFKLICPEVVTFMTDKGTAEIEAIPEDFCAGGTWKERGKLDSLGLWMILLVKMIFG